MTEAKRIALLIGSPVGGLQGVSNDIRQIASRLEVRGFECRRCEGDRATRDEILAQLDRLRGEAEAGDAIVVYYSGHGGRCLLTTGQGGESQVAHNYLVPMDHERETSFRGITDFELALTFRTLTDKTPNVTVILDCCHASTMVRGDQHRSLYRDGSEFVGQPQERVRMWVGQRQYEMPRELQASYENFQNNKERLYVDSNPRIVRMVATGAGAPAFEFDHDGVSGGYLTRELCAALDEEHALRSALSDGDRSQVSWDRVARRVRARIIATRKSTTQRPEVEGPSERLLFSTETEADLLDRTTLVRSSDGTAWIEAGTLHGLELGDRVEVFGNQDDVVGVATIKALFADHARVDISANPAAEGSVGSPGPGLRSRDAVAKVADYTRAETVWIEESVAHREGLIRRVEGLARLRHAPQRQGATFVIRMRHDHFEIEGPAFFRRRPRTLGCDLDAMIDDLDDVARGMILEQRLTRPPGLSASVDWSATLYAKPPGGTDEHAVQEDERLPVETRAYLKLASCGRGAPTIFINALDRGVSGRVHLLNPSQPSGVQLRAPEGPGCNEDRVPGLEGVLKLVWPKDVPNDAPARESIIVVASQRPLDLRNVLAVPSELRRRLRDARQARDVAKEAEVERTGYTAPERRLGADLRWDVKRIHFTLVP